MLIEVTSVDEARSGKPYITGRFSWEMQRRVFQIPSEMQRALGLLRPDYTKERNKRERGHSLGVWRHSTTKTKWR